MKGRHMLLLALTGSAAYPLLEIAYRGRTHPAMALAGALCLPMIRRCAQLPCRRATRALAAACLVTLCEGCIGAVCNRDHRIWDYRNNKGHIAGQVCPRFFCLWYGLCWLLTFRSRKNRIKNM